jgi:hypothetical protein
MVANMTESELLLLRSKVYGGLLAMLEVTKRLDNMAVSDEVEQGIAFARCAETSARGALQFLDDMRERLKKP